MSRTEPANAIKTKPYVLLGLLSKREAESEQKANAETYYTVNKTEGIRQSFHARNLTALGLRAHYRTRTSILSTEVMTSLIGRHLALNLKEEDCIQEGT